MSAKRTFIAILIILVAVGGFIAGLVLLQKPQDVREEAAVPGGQAKVSLQPATGNFKVGDTIQTNIMFNTANIAISGVSVRLTYPFTGTTPEVSVASVDVNPTLLSSGYWTCPTKTTNQQAGNVVIEIGCANTHSAGFTASTDTMLATLKFMVNRQPQTNPMLLRFDNSLSVITQKSNGADILLIPTSTGSYTIGDATATVTTTTSPSPTGKLTTTVTPTKKITATVSPKASASATPAKLPDAGVATPTLLGIGLGALVIIGSLFLAL